MDAFVNPSAPPSAAHVDVEATPSRLTNADFRRLLMTPRVDSASGGAALGATGGSSTTAAASSSAAAATGSSGHAGATADVTSTAPGHGDASHVKSGEGAPGGGSGSKIDRAEERRRKKSYYAKLKRTEEDIMSELAKKYRDRAKERRECGDAAVAGTAGTAGAGGPEVPADHADGTAGAYRAVAPDLKSGRDAAERRRQQIQESKFLGGDMEHTHLVKGLDYALLQKVRSEIQAIEQEHEHELDQLAANIDTFDSVDGTRDSAPKEQELQFKTKMAKNIHRLLCREDRLVRNELFNPGRMAYRIDLDEDLVNTDVPTTLIRSKADCPQQETSSTMTTNDIVINKLTQVLSYLRQGRTGRRFRRKERKPNLVIGCEAAAAAPAAAAAAQDAIFQDSADYGRSDSKQRSSLTSTSDSRLNAKSEGASYFDDGVSHRETSDSRSKFRGQVEETRPALAGDLVETYQERVDRDLEDKQRYESEKNRDSNWLGAASSTAIKKEESKKMGLSMGGGEYAECYPGFDEMHAALEDSDEEVDFNKMDQGNRKGPMGRWDFANTDEYSDYMNRKEALPRAAFQYGVKMADGRKTQGRRLARHPEKSEKAELDREWQKISAIISKRQGGPGGKSDSKKAKHQ